MALETRADRDCLAEAIRRRAAARRLCQLVVLGESTMCDVRRAFGAACGPDKDQVVEALFLTALRRWDCRDLVRRDLIRRGLIEFQGTVAKSLSSAGWWKAQAGSIRSDGYCFDQASDAIEWLVERYMETAWMNGESTEDVFLDIGVNVAPVDCRSELAHDEQGWCERCRYIDTVERFEEKETRAFTDVALKRFVGSRAPWSLIPN